MIKKYIEDKDGNKVLPITHFSAVKDSNGDSLEDVLYTESTYDPTTYSGMGRKVLQKNIVGGVNTLTQSMMPVATGGNTIYIIRYDFTLGENITVPANCILEFDGGSISGAYTLTGDNTIIEGRGYIFKSGVSFTGSFTIHDAKAEWFGVHPTNTDNAAYINVALKFVRSTQTKILTFNSGRYAVKNPITFGSDTDGDSVNRQGWDIVIEGAGQGSSLPTSAGGGGWGTTFVLSNDGYFFVNQLSAASGWGRSGAIRNCSFVGEEGTERGIIINQCFPYEISNCYFYGLGAAVSLTGAAYYCNIFNCRFRSNEYCIKTLTSEEEYYDANGANNNQVHNCTFQYNDYTIYLPVGEGWHIYDCDFEPDNGTLYLGSGNSMDNVRIERNNADVVWLKIDSNNIIRATSVISAGTTTNNVRILIIGSNNDVELSLSGHNVNALQDKAGDNKINITNWTPSIASFAFFPYSDDITICGVNNKLPTEQGANIVELCSQIGGTEGYVETVFPGIQTMKTSSARAFVSETKGDFAVMLMHFNINQEIIFNTSVGYLNEIDGAIDVYCVIHTKDIDGIRKIETGNAANSYHHFASISRNKPCFLNVGIKNRPTISIGTNYTDIYLNSLEPIYCFGMKPDGASRNPAFTPAARFWYKGIRYVCYVDGLEFKFHPFDSGTTAQRPTADFIDVGFRYFDTTLGKPIFAKAISGSTITWVDATDTPV